jgi:hypothetical protein
MIASSLGGRWRGSVVCLVAAALLVLVPADCIRRDNANAARQLSMNAQVRALVPTESLSETASVTCWSQCRTSRWNPAFRDDSYSETLRVSRQQQAEPPDAPRSRLASGEITIRSEQRAWIAGVFQSARVTDVSCSSADLAPLAARFLTAFEADGVDVSQARASLARL